MAMELGSAKACWTEHSIYPTAGAGFDIEKTSRESVVSEDENEDEDVVEDVVEVEVEVEVEVYINILHELQYAIRSNTS